MQKFPIHASRRLRATPYTERVEASGLTGYTIYNHMLLPTSFGSLESDCQHLKEFGLQKQTMHGPEQGKG